MLCKIHTLFYSKNSDSNTLTYKKYVNLLIRITNLEARNGPVGWNWFERCLYTTLKVHHRRTCCAALDTGRQGRLNRLGQALSLSLSLSRGAAAWLGGVSRGDEIFVSPRTCRFLRQLRSFVTCFVTFLKDAFRNDLKRFKNRLLMQVLETSLIVPDSLLYYDKERIRSEPASCRRLLGRLYGRFGIPSRSLTWLDTY